MTVAEELPPPTSDEVLKSQHVAAWERISLQIEPESVAWFMADKRVNSEMIAQFSIAISTKRLADAAETTLRMAQRTEPDS